MKYERIVRYVASNLWSITAEKMSELLEVLAFRASGQTFTAEEIQARIGDSGLPARSQPRGAIAVIPIRGVIAHRMGSMDDTSGGTSAERIGLMLRSALGEESIDTILLDVDSPGGTVEGIQELAQQIFEAREQKKIIAIAHATMASAAYWLSAQADEIVAIPSAISVGSIGVFSVHQDLSKALEQEGVNVTLIKAGKFKTEGNPFEPLSDVARQAIQDKVDASYERFVKDVARGRGVTPTAVKNGFGEGRALNAKDAKAAGLIDRIATWDETIARLVGKASSASSGGVRAEAEELPIADTDSDRATRLRLA